MKILVLTSTYSRHKDDTLPKFVDHLNQHLAQTNDIHVLAPHAPGIGTSDVLDGIPITRFRYFPERWQSLAYEGGILPNLKENPFRVVQIPFFLISQWWSLVRILRREKYDIVHAHWLIPQGLCAVLARPLARWRPAVIVTSHGGDMFSLKGSLFARLKGWIVRQADHLTVVSSVMKDKVVAMGFNDTHVSVIPMGVDAQQVFVPPAQEGNREGLVFVGRLVEKKGLQYLLRAMPAILAENPGLDLSIIGDGPLKTQLQALATNLGIENAVCFEGALLNRDIPERLRLGAIAIVPSVVTSSGDQEGAPVSVMESLACGCPTIVSDYPGARDLITDGVNGLLVAVESPDDIANRVNHLLNDDRLQAALGEQGRGSILAGFDWRVIAERFEAVFKPLIRT